MTSFGDNKQQQPVLILQAGDQGDRKQTFSPKNSYLYYQPMSEGKKKGEKLIRACREGETIPAQSEPVMDYPLLGKGSVMAFGIGLQVTPQASLNKATLFTPLLKVLAVRLY